MISILIGFIALAALFVVLYWTGRLSENWSTDRDELDERDYLGKGFALWLLIGLVLFVCFLIGKTILAFT